MHAFLVLLVVVLCTGLSLSCGRTTLSEQEAKTIIAEAVPAAPLPSMLVDDIIPRQFPQMVDGIKRLAADGYLKCLPPRIAAGDRMSPVEFGNCEPTEKAKPYLPQGVAWNHVHGYYFARVSVGNVRLQTIKEILIDEKSNTAIVSYTVGIEPVEPFYSVFCVEAKRCPYAGAALHQTVVREINLTKYDKGWRVTR